MGDNKVTSIIGFSVLGNPKQYNLVTYRVYVPKKYEKDKNYEAKERESILAVSRLSSIALLSSLLAHTYSNNYIKEYYIFNNKLHMGFIVPITLLTQLDSHNNYYDPLKILELLNNQKCDKAFKYFLNGLFSNIEKSININKNLLKYVEEKLKNKIKNDPVSMGVIPHHISIKKDTIKNIKYTSNNKECGFPAIYSVESEIFMKKFLKNNSNNRNDQIIEKISSNLALYFAVVPIPLATRYNNKIILFRESGKGTIKGFNLALDATIAYSLSYITKTILQNIPVNDLRIVFVDTSLGLNNLVSALSRNEHRVWANVAIHNFLTYKNSKNYILLRYNSDPVPISPGRIPDPIKRDIKYFEYTLKYNMNYNYIYIKDHDVAASIKSDIEKIIEFYYLISKNNNSSGKNNNFVINGEWFKALLLIYFVKLGLLHWAIISSILNKEDLYFDEVFISIKKSGNNIYNVNFEATDSDIKYLKFLIKEYYNSLIKYLNKLYYEIKCESGYECLLYPKHNNMICISLKRFRDIISNKSISSSEHELLRYIVDRSSSIMISNDLDIIIDEFPSRLKYLINDKNINIKDKKDCVRIVENRGSNLYKNDGKIILFKPDQKIITKDNKKRIIRNFIAHAGLLNLTGKLKFIIYINKDDKCKPVCVCIEEPIEESKIKYKQDNQGSQVEDKDALEVFKEQFFR